MSELIIDKDAEQLNFHWNLSQKHAESAIDHAIECGRILAKKKEELPHGEFLPWVDKHFKHGERHAQRLMRLATDLNATLMSHLPLTHALELLNASDEVKEVVQEKIDNGEFVSQLDELEDELDKLSDNFEDELDRRMKDNLRITEEIEAQRDRIISQTNKQIAVLEKTLKDEREAIKSKNKEIYNLIESRAKEIDKAKQDGIESMLKAHNNDLKELERRKSVWEEKISKAKDEYASLNETNRLLRSSNRHRDAIHAHIRGIAAALASFMDDVSHYGLDDAIEIKDDWVAILREYNKGAGQIESLCGLFNPKPGLLIGEIA